MPITQTITSFPTAPDRTMAQSTFDSAVAAYLAAMSTNVTEQNALASQMNALAAAMNAVAAGSALAISYTFDATTTDSDPGAGKLRLNNATQNAATAIRADVLGTDGADYTNMIGTFDDSTSTVKGYILLQKVADPTKFLLFSVSALATPSGYRNITVANVAYSAASPFADGDSIVLKFTPTGDKGDTGSPGTPGWNLIGSPVTASGAATADVESTFDSTYDVYAIVGKNVRGSTNGVNIRAQFKLGGAYVTTGTYKYHVDFSSSATSTYTGNQDTTDTALKIAESVGNASDRGCDFIMYVWDPTSSRQKCVDWIGHKISDANVFTKNCGAGCNTGTGALEGVRFAASSDNISGTFWLFGLRKS